MIRILKENDKTVGSSTPELTLADYPTVDDPVRNDSLKSSDRLKQEIECMEFIEFHRILYTVAPVTPTNAFNKQTILSTN